MLLGAWLLGFAWSHVTMSALWFEGRGAWHLEKEHMEGRHERQASKVGLFPGQMVECLRYWRSHQIEKDPEGALLRAAEESNPGCIALGALIEAAGPAYWVFSRSGKAPVDTLLVLIEFLEEDTPILVEGLDGHLHAFPARKRVRSQLQTPAQQKAREAWKGVWYKCITVLKNSEQHASLMAAAHRLIRDRIAMGIRPVLTAEQARLVPSNAAVLALALAASNTQRHDAVESWRPETVLVEQVLPKVPESWSLVDSDGITWRFPGKEQLQWLLNTATKRQWRTAWPPSVRVEFWGRPDAEAMVQAAAGVLGIVRAAGAGQTA